MSIHIVRGKYRLVTLERDNRRQIKQTNKRKLKYTLFLPVDINICRSVGSSRLQNFELLLRGHRNAVGGTTTGYCQFWHRVRHWHHLWTGSPSGSMASLAFHRLSWTMAASVYVPFTILLVSYSIPWAPPFLPISPTTPSRLRISVVARVTKMESAPSHYVDWESGRKRRKKNNR